MMMMRSYPKYRELAYNTPTHRQFRASFECTSKVNFCKTKIPNISYGNGFSEFVIKLFQYYFNIFKRNFNIFSYV